MKQTYQAAFYIKLCVFINLLISPLFFNVVIASDLNATSTMEYISNQQCIRDRAELNSLTCTANDISLSNMKVASGLKTCVAGGTITRGLDFEVITTAKNRYNWSFYTTTVDGSNPLDGDGNGGHVCSIWYGHIGSKGAIDANSMDLNGDICTDAIKSTNKSNNNAMFTNQSLTFECIDTTGDDLVDIEFCATWDQNDSSLCELDGEGEIIADSLPAPGAPSKCNCSTVSVDIKIIPSIPELTISPASQNRTEEQVYRSEKANDDTGTFTFDLVITNINENKPITITSLTDNFAGIDFAIPSSMNSAATSLAGNDYLKLLSASDDSAYNGDDFRCLASGEEVIAPGGVYTCTVKYRWFNLDLIDNDENPDTYAEVIENNFSISWYLGENDPANEGPSGSVKASISDVPPKIKVTKDASPQTIPETGAIDFDLITYTVGFENLSGWDVINIAPANLTDSLKQNGGNIITALLSATPCGISGLNFGPNGKKTCEYAVNLATDYNGSPFPSLDQGDSYENTVNAIPTDEEGTNGVEDSAMATVIVTNIAPVVTLKKSVKAGSYSSNYNDYSDANDTTTAAKISEYQLTDTSGAPMVTYLFEVTNNSFEPFYIIDFVDFASNENDLGLEPPNIDLPSNMVSANDSPVGDCSNLIDFEEALQPGGGVRSCTITYRVTGDDTDTVKNTAWVLIEDEDTDDNNLALSTDFAIDHAYITFYAADNQLALGLDLQAIIEVSISADNSNVEPIEFNPWDDFLISIDGIEKSIFGGIDLPFVITLDDPECNDGKVTLEPGDVPFVCQFIVSSDDVFSQSSALTVISKSFKVRARDDDGTTHSLSAVLDVKASPPVSN